MKYIIEIKPEYEDTTRGIMVLEARDSNLFVDAVDVANLEVLNSDYINERFSDLQDTAYQRGLEDAWKAAKKIVLDTNHGGIALSDLGKIFGGQSYTYIMNKNTAQEAIAKLKAYEEKQKHDDKIEVGDEVNWLGDCFIVTRIFQPRNMKEQCDGIDDDGCVYHDVLMDDLEKTGRHFDIAKILEEMKA